MRRSYEKWGLCLILAALLAFAAFTSWDALTRPAPVDFRWCAVAACMWLGWRVGQRAFRRTNP